MSHRCGASANCTNKNKWRSKKVQMMTGRRFVLRVGWTAVSADTGQETLDRSPVYHWGHIETVHVHIHYDRETESISYGIKIQTARRRSSWTLNSHTTRNCISSHWPFQLVILVSERKPANFAIVLWLWYFRKGDTGLHKVLHSATVLVLLLLI